MWVFHWRSEYPIPQHKETLPFFWRRGQGGVGVRLPRNEA